MEHMDRFDKDFGVDVEEDADDVEAKNSKLKKSSKPSDYQALFGANNNDHFMVGIKFTRYYILVMLFLIGLISYISTVSN